ncbi:MAG: hypothetical protein JO062_19820 [Bryobacterales bacterium]|nr:hypothetical protein [Bryobacterales bacterium]
MNRIFLSMVLVLCTLPLLKLFGANIGGFVTVMQQVIPGEARSGDVVTVTGYALDDKHVMAVYLTNGQNDFGVEILEQNTVALRFKVPANIPSGVMRLAIVVNGRSDILEQPVFLKILPEAGE